MTRALCFQYTEGSNSAGTVGHFASRNSRSLLSRWRLTKTQTAEPAQDDSIEAVRNPNSGTGPVYGGQVNTPEAHAVSVVQPYGVADDVRRKAMPKVAGSTSVHLGIVPRGELT